MARPSKIQSRYQVMAIGIASGMTITDAAKKAGYSQGWINVNSSTILKDPDFKVLLDGEINKIREDVIGITKEFLVSELRKVKDKDGISNRDKITAINSIAKILGYEQNAALSIDGEGLTIVLTPTEDKKEAKEAKITEVKPDEEKSA